MKSFTDMTSTDSKLLGVVLRKVLEKQYPILNPENRKQYPQLKPEDIDWITLDVLLDWVLWPNYLKIVQQGYTTCTDC